MSLVYGYRFITPQKLKINEIETDEVFFQRSFWKANFSDGCVTKLQKNQLQKTW